MDNPSKLANFFNDISICGLDDLAQNKLEDISSTQKLLEESFSKDIGELKQQSVGNKTRTNLLNSTNNVEFIMKGIVDESSLEKQAQFINYWISKLLLCQKTITMLVTFLKRKCEHYKLHWNEYNEKDPSDTFDKNRLFLQLIKTYIQVHGICQNIGMAIYDYSDLQGLIQSNIDIKEKDFRKPLIADPEITVSERISRLDGETENCLLINPKESILGFSAVRIELESYIVVNMQDKMRQHIRIKDGNNKRDVKFSSRLKTKDVFQMIKDFFPQQKEYDALNVIYGISSKTVHRALPYPNYLSWGSLEFVLDKLRKMIDHLDPNDIRLQTTITKLKNEGKLRIVNSKWHM
jgi:hypothetical protein